MLMPLTMKSIYENQIKDIGPMAEEFLSDKMVILFGNEAPEGLKEFCYIIEVAPVNGEIQPGQALYINDERFEITSVGDIVQQNLVNLGHITIRFDGSPTPELPGTLYLEDKAVPAFGVGTEIKIVQFI